MKRVSSDNYNYVFNRKTGFFARWGKSYDDNPKYSPIGPEIFDMEISTICNGLGKPCPWCYKSNTEEGKNMSFETFKTIFHNLPKNVNQIAFGIGDIDGNPDMFSIFEYCRNNDYNFVVPNVTINGYKLNDDYANKLSEVCGAIAVSHYYNDDICFDAIKKLTDKGMNQVNIHKLLSEETYQSCFDLIDKAKNDPRLLKLNAVVFLLLKPKGKRNKLHSISDVEKYKKLIDYAFEKGVNFGFDSCSAGKFLEAVKDRSNFKELEMNAEPCESTIFSGYCDVDGEFFPCSFMEKESGWENGIDIKKCDNFLKDVWYNDKVKKFRINLLEKNKCGNLNCPFFPV